MEKFAKGNRPQAARALTNAEDDFLSGKGLFGNNYPEVLPWDESRKLKWGDVGLDFDPDTGKEILVWRAEHGFKTRHGDVHQRAFSPTAQATNNRRCPVTLLVWQNNVSSFRHGQSCWTTEQQK